MHSTFVGFRSGLDPSVGIADFSRICCHVNTPRTKDKLMHRSGTAAVFSVLFLSGTVLAQTKPLPLPPPIRFEEVCLQSGGAAGAITPSLSNGNMSYTLLEADRPILFTFNLAEGTRAVTIKWTDAKGAQRENIVAGATTFTVVASAFTLVANESGPAAWCTRAQAL